MLNFFRRTSEITVEPTAIVENPSTALVAQGATSSTLVVPSAEPAQEEGSYHGIIAQGTVMNAAIVAMPVGSTIGGYLGRVAGIPIAERVGERVEEVVRAEVSRAASEALAATGLSRVPGVEWLLDAEAMNIGHAAGERSRQAALNASTATGAAAGGFIAGAGTVALLEAINGIGLLYTRFLGASYQSRSDDRLRALAAAQDQEEERALAASSSAPSLRLS
ncbi:hypothetical protein [Candidatus Berkiella aquae]|uniref:Uncharacterized protein n=1 Tax=Candidatus Berkiella aquae TaxID=295108 RepID=A0A0Q9YWF8_9GAMM|nr:hypothetical protein [Candidatus Berkiella aquae]MCS5710852.1 hypothetical protein [Candidatus Berkiella aquae]